jgi:CRISPR-associated protein Csx14
MRDELKPSISVKVDPTNPGQFFACCGLLELADRLWPGAEIYGNFTEPKNKRSKFTISSTQPLSLEEIVSALLKCERRVVEPYQPILGGDGKPVKDAKKIKPVLLTDGDLLSVRLSWWLDELTGKQTSLKTWSAHSTSEGLISQMAEAIPQSGITEQSAFDFCVGMTSRLGVDTRSSWNTLDEGFSPNDQTLPVDTYPVTELLAAIGLETFRPTKIKHGYCYACWLTPMPTLVACAIASGSVSIQGISRYRFDVGSRGKFKFFTKAALLERNADD